jgi:hypothetical protein
MFKKLTKRQQLLVKNTADAISVSVSDALKASASTYAQTHVSRDFKDGFSAAASAIGFTITWTDSE